MKVYSLNSNHGNQNVKLYHNLTVPFNETMLKKNVHTYNPYAHNVHYTQVINYTLSFYYMYKLFQPVLITSSSEIDVFS